MIKLSVIIPIYNTPAPLLDHCISSIRDNLCLMGDEVEVLMINDGSIESHIEPMLKAVETADSRFKYVYKDNSGVSMTRNLGIEMAQGEYITFIDADDYFEPDALFYMLQTAMRTDVDMVMFGFCRNDVDVKERKSFKQRFDVNKEIIQTLISNNMQWWYSRGWGIYFRGFRERMGNSSVFDQKTVFKQNSNFLCRQYSCISLCYLCLLRNSQIL